MDVGSISEVGHLAEPAGAQGKKDDPVLKSACEQFEGMLLGMVLKDGLKRGVLDEEGDHSASILQDFGVEQMARSLSAGGQIGIADMMYQQMQMQ